MTMTKESPAQTPLEPAPQGRGWFTPYREDQGRHARMAAFWSVVFFLVFGCRFMHQVLSQWESLRKPLNGIRIPVVSVDLSPAFLMSFAVFCAGLLLIHRWQQRPKVADLLIDTEAELKKVSWPKGEEVWNAAMVVIVSVVLLGVFLALVDIFLFRLMRYLILGES